MLESIVKNSILHSDLAVELETAAGFKFNAIVQSRESSHSINHQTLFDSISYILYCDPEDTSHLYSGEEVILDGKVYEISKTAKIDGFLELYLC